MVMTVVISTVMNCHTPGMMRTHQELIATMSQEVTCDIGGPGCYREVIYYYGLACLIIWEIPNVYKILLLVLADLNSSDSLIWKFLYSYAFLELVTDIFIPDNSYHMFNSIFQRGIG